MIHPLRPIVAVPAIALTNAVVMGLGDGAYQYLMGTEPLIRWPASFRILFWYTLIFASISGLFLAPVMLWAGKSIPRPKIVYLLAIGLILGPLPIALLDGRQALGWTTIVSFSGLGALSASLWWWLVERHRMTLDMKLEEKDA